MDTTVTSLARPGADANQLLRINDVVALTTLSKSCVNLWVSQGRFPKPTALSKTVKVWKSSDITDWIHQQFETTARLDDELRNSTC